VNRRRFLGSLAASVVAGVGAARLVVDPQPRTFAQAPTDAVAGSGPTAPGALLPPPPPVARIPLPGGGAPSRIPGDGDLLALTLDDGVSSDVVRAYAQFARDTGARMTFFVNGVYQSWTQNRELLRPLVDSGQIQLGNHTWSHPDLTALPQAEIAAELTHNDAFLKRTYGVGAQPYYRPPYAKHNATVEAVAADLGYTVPTLWSGSLSRAPSTRELTRRSAGPGARSGWRESARSRSRAARTPGTRLRPNATHVARPPTSRCPPPGPAR